MKHPTLTEQKESREIKITRTLFSLLYIIMVFDSNCTTYLLDDTHIIIYLFYVERIAFLSYPRSAKFITLKPLSCKYFISASNKFKAVAEDSVV